MIKTFRFLTAALGMLTACAATAIFAQDIRSDEATYPYGSARGWTVVSVDKRAGVVGCRATIVQGVRFLGIENVNGEWNLIVRNPANGTFAGGIVSVDGFVVDSQFGFSNGYAIKTLTAPTLSRIRQGSTLRVRVNGFAEQSFSLTGSSAAILKVTECVRNAGEVPTATPPAQSSLYPDDGERRNLTCAPYAGAKYPCVAVERVTKPGYTEVFEVNPAFGGTASPYYLFEVLDGAYQADVWVLFSPQGDFEYFGRWDLNQQGSSRCAEPASNQNADVRQRMGQDAWGLCFF